MATAQLPALKEKELQKAVVDHAHRMGWRVAHFRTSRTQSGGWATAVSADGKGFPDLVLVRKGRLLFVELKAKGGRLSEEQRQWLFDLTEVDDATDAVEVEMWDPSDWDSHHIHDVLA